MKAAICKIVIVCTMFLIIPNMSEARGTRYVIDWPEGHYGPVYVQVYDIRVNPPYTLADRFKVWVTWGNQTKCYEIDNYGSYWLKFYKYDHCTGPMIVSGLASSFKIRYSIAPPWI